MSLSLANPYGLWALLGLPAVVAIHFLQRRSRRVRATTLFLLEQMRRESQTGSRIERLRTSIPFWLQLLMVLLLTWLLVQPRWLKNNAVRRIAIVLDSSASMQAFRTQALATTDEALSRLLGLAPVAAELTLLPSDPEAPALYHGTSASELLAAARDWDPLLGVHDFTPALRVGRNLVSAKGVLLLITDHPPSAAPPFDARVISVGGALPNAGWTGVQVEQKEGQWVWHAMVRNYSSAVQERTWTTKIGSARSVPKALTLRPGEIQTLSGPFPTGGVDRATLELNADGFTLDDVLPLVRPQPKVLAVAVQDPFAKTGAPSRLADLFSRYPDVRLVPSPAGAHVTAALASPNDQLPEQHSGCFFLPPAQGNPPYAKGNVVAEPHTLVEGLNWQPLLVREAPALTRHSNDRVLVWQADRPLIVLRQMPAGGRLLLCNFDLDTSNALKLPAFAVLLHRFLESVRHDLVTPEAANFDLRQRIDLAHQRGENAPPVTLVIHTGDDKAGTLEEAIPAPRIGLLRAPPRPMHFEIRQGEIALLTGAAHFADGREADLSSAAPFNDLALAVAEQIETTHEADPNWRAWLLLLVALLLGSWWFSREKRERMGPPDVQAQPDAA